MDAKKQRHLKNILLQPFLQLKLGLYSILLALAFVFVFVWVLVVSFRRLFELILDLTDLRQEVLEIINSSLIDIGGWLLLVVAIYVLASIALSVIYTHKLVGPTIAFRRHIKALSDGDTTTRITLRKSDAFAEVAEDLNELAEVLGNKSKG